MARERSRDQQRAIFAALRRRRQGTRYGLRVRRLLTPQEENRLGHLVKHGSEHQKLAARNELVAANQRLVAKIAHTFKHRGLGIKDLIQEGNIGILKAAETYDYERGNRFSTHATNWIKQSIGRAIENRSSEVRIPAESQWHQNTLRKLSQQFYQKVGREPTIDELSKISKLNRSQVMDAIALKFQTVSTNKQIGKDRNDGKILTLEDTLIGSDVSGRQYDHDMERDDKILDAKRAFLSQRLSKLSPTERTIITNKYIFSKSNQASGKQLKLTRQRVNQIEREALTKLRTGNFTPEQKTKLKSRLKSFISKLRGNK